MGYTVITGASAGIGRALAKKFAAEGHNLIIAARREDRLTALKAEILENTAIEVVILPVDLADTESLHHFYAQTKIYPVDVFINNAGLGDYSYVWDLDPAKAEQMVDVNIRALMNLSLNFVKDNLDREATLINVSSGGGYFVLSGAVIYCATKFFVSSFTEGLAQNLIAEGKKLRAKVLAPGATESEFVQVAETGAGFTGAELFPPEIFIPAEQVAEFGYRLYQSDKILGIVRGKDRFDLRDPIFPYGG